MVLATKGIITKRKKVDITIIIAAAILKAGRIPKAALIVAVDLTVTVDHIPKAAHTVAAQVVKASLDKRFAHLAAGELCFYLTCFTVSHLHFT